MSFDSSFFAEALTRREDLIQTLHSEDTNAYRLFHGAVEGFPGLTVDRYGSLIVAQTFRDPLFPEHVLQLEEWYTEHVQEAEYFVYNHRKKKKNVPFEAWHEPKPEALELMECREGGVVYLNCARHRGIDPLFFLDFRVVRRWLQAHARGQSVLNLFAYTGTAGICAAHAGAHEVWNVDFAETSINWGKQSAARNDLEPGQIQWVQEDVFPIIRQLAGLPIKGRARRKGYTRCAPQQFDIVILDPPTWAKSRWGAVDLVNDYQSLFKPSLLAVADGGSLIAANHVAYVDLQEWSEALQRCAAKAGRPLKSIEILTPEGDFPSFDQKHPLKLALCRV